MREYPILFSGPLVNAIQRDRKFVTRRLSKQWLKWARKGNRLWVRETWQPIRSRTDTEQAQTTAVLARFFAGAIPAERIVEAAMSLPVGSGEKRALYAADFGDWAYDVDSDLRPWRPSIYMPRKFSRILLECEEDARLERLHDITEQEAMDEGFYQAVHDSPNGIGQDVVGWFCGLWSTLHNKPGERWEDNPEVVRVGRFRRIA